MENPGKNCCHGKSWKSLGIWKFPKKSWNCLFSWLWQLSSLWLSCMLWDTIITISETMWEWESWKEANQSWKSHGILFSDFCGNPVYVNWWHVACHMKSVPWTSETCWKIRREASVITAATLVGKKQTICCHCWRRKQKQWPQHFWVRCNTTKRKDLGGLLQACGRATRSWKEVHYSFDGWTHDMPAKNASTVCITQINSRQIKDADWPGVYFIMY